MATGAALALWQVLWALILGVLLAAVLRVAGDPDRIARGLGRPAWQPLALALLLGAVLPIPSLAAAVTAQVLVALGAHPAVALLFLAATVPALGAASPGLSAPLALLVMTAVTLPFGLVPLPRSWRARAGRGGARPGRHCDWLDALTSDEGWRRIAGAFAAELRLAAAPAAVGHLVAGATGTALPLAGALAWLLVRSHGWRHGLAAAAVLCAGLGLLYALDLAPPGVPGAGGDITLLNLGFLALAAALLWRRRRGEGERDYRPGGRYRRYTRGEG